MRIDAVSMLAEIEGSMLLSEAEHELSRFDFTLGISGHAAWTLARWVAEGMPSRREGRDPVDHTLAGLQGALPGERSVTIRPCPRRAVGPDLSALFVGVAWSRIDRAWLRIHPLIRRHVSPTPWGPPLARCDEPLGPEERRWFERIARELSDRGDQSVG